MLAGLITVVLFTACSAQYGSQWMNLQRGNFAQCYREEQYTCPRAYTDLCCDSNWMCRRNSAGLHCRVYQHEDNYNTLWDYCCPGYYFETFDLSEEDRNNKKETAWSSQSPYPNMARIVLGSVLASAEAASLVVTYQDCGAKHCHFTDLEPTEIHTGATEALTGTGTCDEDVTSAHFTATVSALGAKLSECSGDGTKDIVCNLPMGVGKITVNALSFPIAKGTVSIPVEVETSRLIPASLTNVDVHIAAEDQNGESLICLDVHTAKAMSEEAAPAPGPAPAPAPAEGPAPAPAPEEGACTSDEQSALGDSQTVGNKVNDCVTSSYNLFTGDYNHDKFNDCFSSSIGISNTCSECYAVSAEYGAKNCWSSCIAFGPCESDCQSCVEPAVEDLATCTGFTPADPCEDRFQGGNLAVTWEDCGAQHGVVTDLQPLSFHTGTQVTITGTGTTDEDVTSAQFSGSVSALGVELGKFSGDGTEDLVINLPFGLGHVSMLALPFPMQKGTVSIPVDVKTSRFIPARFAKVDVVLEAVDQNGERLICLKVHTAKSVEDVVVV